MTQNYNLNNHIEIWTLSLKLSILFLLIKVASYNPSIIFRNKKENFQAFYKCSIFTPWLLTCSRCYVYFNFLRFRVSYHTALLVHVVTVGTSCPKDPCCCQVDVCYKPRRSSGSVDPAKDVRTGCPDTPSDGFVSHGLRDQTIGLF